MLNIVVALHCEAKPLINQFKLKKIVNEVTPFPIFVNTEQSIFLIISGVGKIKTAMATTFLYSWTGKLAYSCFLNVGIAGSGEFAIGEVVLANKIIEHATQRSWYPFLSLLKNKKSSLAITYDLPQVHYPQSGMVDMEASAFFQAASTFVTQEHIQVIKIISDNLDYSTDKITENTVNELIKQKISAILEVTDYLMNLSSEAKARQFHTDIISDFLKNWRFTHAQTVQLTEMIRRWEIHLLQDSPLLFCQNEKNAAQVIHKLTQKLDDYANYLY